MSAALEKTVVAVLLLAVTIPVFFAAGALTPTHAAAPWLATRWDMDIPLMPAAVWLYLSWYLAPWLLLAAPRREFRLVATAIALAFALCTLGYVLVPAAMERPAVFGRTVSERALILLYQYDPPWNIFPSFHAALCAVLLWRPPFGGALARRIMAVWMLAICAACVLIKQHEILDIVAGLLVGIVALAAASTAFNYLERLAAETGSPRGSQNPASP